MNLQQLNGSGTSIGVFLGTAVILFLVTEMSWRVLEGLQDARTLIRQSEQEGRPVLRRTPAFTYDFI